MEELWHFLISDGFSFAFFVQIRLSSLAPPGGILGAPGTFSMNLAAGGEEDNPDDSLLSDNIRSNGPVLDFGPETEFQ